MENMSLSMAAHLYDVVIKSDSDNHYLSRRVRHAKQRSSWSAVKIRRSTFWLIGVASNIRHFNHTSKRYYHSY